jgi:hypothetical protein
MKMDLGHCQLRKTKNQGLLHPTLTPINGKGNRQLKFCWCNKKQFIKRARDIRSMPLARLVFLSRKTVKRSIDTTIFYFL